MPRKWLLLIAASLSLILSACGGSAPSATPTSPHDATKPVPRLVWTSFRVSAGTGPSQPTSISCPSASFCLADDSGSAYTYTPSGWASQGYPKSTIVSCLSDTRCVSTNSTYSYGSNGPKWTSITPTPSTLGIYGISCPHSGVCRANDATDVYTFEDGLWSQGNPIDPGGVSDNGGLTAISCPSSGFCMVGGLFGTVYQYGAGRWSNAIDVAPRSVKLYDSQTRKIGSFPNSLSVSCPTTTFCLGIDSVGRIYKYQDGHWSQSDVSVPLTKDDLPTSLSCGSADLCVVAGLTGKTPDDISEGISTSGWAQVFQGSSWSSRSVLVSDFWSPSVSSQPFSGEASVLVSCSGSAFCMAVASNGDAYELHAG